MKESEKELEEEVKKWWRGLDDDTKEEIGYDYDFIADDYGFDADDPDSGWFKLSLKKKLKIYKLENR